MSESTARPAGEGTSARPLLPGTPRRVLLRIERLLVRIEVVFGVLIMATMGILLLTQVFSRYVINLPVFWVEEVARLTMIWMVLVGIGYAVSTNTHLRVTALTDRLPDTIRIWLERLILVAIVVVGVLLAMAGADLAERLASVSASSSGLSRSLYFLPTAIGFGLAAVHAVIVILTRPLTSADEKPDTPAGEPATEAMP